MGVQIQGDNGQCTLPRDGTFKIRNVSIAGTLTYEDVTNIDSSRFSRLQEHGIQMISVQGLVLQQSISVDGNMIVSGIINIWLLLTSLTSGNVITAR